MASQPQRATHLGRGFGTRDADLNPPVIFDDSSIIAATEPPWRDIAAFKAVFRIAERLPSGRGHMERSWAADPPAFNGHEPPSYSDGNEVVDKSIQRPITLRIIGRFVYSDETQAPPLYELSHNIESLSDANNTVTFQCLQQVVKQRNGTPLVSTRTRHLYDLKHPSFLTSTFLFHADATSRQSLCSFGITSFRPRKLSSARGYQIDRVVRGPDRLLASRNGLFTAMPSKDRAVAFEWFDPQGLLLARELQQGEYQSLLITAEMSLDVRDALAAAWVLKAWWEMIEGRGPTRRWYLSKLIQA